MTVKMDPNQKVVYSIIERHVRGARGEGPDSLIEALNLRRREVISLVGAGGKTTLMFRLAKELTLAGKKVVTTTTTKIMEPSPQETPCLLVGYEEEGLEQLALQRLDQFDHVTVARERIELNKLKGVSSDWIGLLSGSPKADMVIIEADGAAGRPVKAPREWEPVIADQTTLVIGLLGVDGVEKELNEENFFQAERISQLTGIPMGEKMTCRGMAVLTLHPKGIFKGSPASARRIVWLNKMDVSRGRRWGREIGKEILGQGSSPIERVILGQLRSEPPVLEVIDPSMRDGDR